MTKHEDARKEELLALGVREECVDGVRVLVSTAAMMHDAVAHRGRLLVSSQKNLLVEGDVGDLAGNLVVVLQSSAFYADGCVVSPHGSVVSVGEWFFFDRGSSPRWAGGDILSLVDDQEAMGVIGIGF